MIQHSYGTWPFIVDPLKIVILHSHVKLPEGIYNETSTRQKYNEFTGNLTPESTGNIFHEVQ